MGENSIDKALKHLHGEILCKTPTLMNDIRAWQGRQTAESSGNPDHASHLIPSLERKRPCPTTTNGKRKKQTNGKRKQILIIGKLTNENNVLSELHRT